MFTIFFSTRSSPPASHAHIPTARRNTWLGIRTHWAALLGVIVVLISFTLAPALEAIQPLRLVQVRAVLPTRTQFPQPGVKTASSTSLTRATKSIQAPGWLEPDPYRVAITALADGVVSKIHVLEGQSVTTGQLVAELVPDDAQLALQQAQNRLAADKAQLDIAQVQLTAATTDWDQPVERDRQVASTEAALDEARAELVQLPAMIRRSQALLRRWQEEFSRIERAYKSSAATERELIVTRQEVAANAAGLEVMQQREGILDAKIARLESERTAASRAAELRVQERRALDTASAQVAFAKSALARSQTELAEAQLRMDRMTIRCSMDGRVMRRLKSPGDKVMLSMDDPYSSHLLHLYDPTSIQVRVDVPLADAAQVVVGQRCEVVVDVLPDVTFQGQVTRITHEADLQKNTLQVKVQVIDPSPLLRPEMLTRVRFLPGDGTVSDDRSSTNAGRSVRVSETCIDSQQVWVVKNRQGLRGRATPVPIETIRVEEGYATVTAALHPGDLVIELPHGLEPGQAVRFEAWDGGKL